ncbi:MAG: cyclase family protein [Chloroflexi bacterium]|nr:cyclase family protein [Chloroflexota bacterium]
MDLAKYRLVDLTHIIEPESGPRPVHIERVPAPHAVPGGMWYIMHRVELTLNHVGTHIEAPYHVRQEGMDVAEIPLERLCGEAVVLDLRFTEPGGVVTEADVRQAAERAGGIRPGDIVLGRFDPQGPGSNRNFQAEAIRYLVDAGMKLMGVDLNGVELPQSDPRAEAQYNHHQLLDRDICLIEQVAHLDRLTKSRVTVFALPIPIKGLDSFPIRLVALEELDR